MHIFCTSLFGLGPDYSNDVSFETSKVLTVTLGQCGKLHLDYETHSSKLPYAVESPLLSNLHQCLTYPHDTYSNGYI